MDALALLPAVVVGAIAAAVNIAWEVGLHRRTRRYVHAVVGEQVVKAQADRDHLLDQLRALREELASAPGAFAGGNVDPREARASREEKEQERVATLALIADQLGIDAVGLLQAVLPPKTLNKLLDRGPAAVALASKFIGKKKASTGSASYI